MPDGKTPNTNEAAKKYYSGKWINITRGIKF